MFTLCLQQIRSAMINEPIMRGCGLPNRTRKRGMAAAERIEPREM
jgi:hypothetical protein